VGCRWFGRQQLKLIGRPFTERTSVQGVNHRGEFVSSRMAGTPAEEEIDEPTGKFLRPRSDIASFRLLSYLSRAT